MTVSQQQRPKPELKIRVRERNKTQEEIPDNSICLSLWVAFGAVRTSLKDLTWLPGCYLPREDMLLGMASWRRIPWVSRRVYTHIPCRGRSPRVTNCFSYESCSTESWWIRNRANKTSMLWTASLPLLYKMFLTSKCKSSEPVSRRLRGRRRITHSLCWLLTPFLWHIQHKFCAQFSLISAGHWKSGYVPELFSTQRELGKKGNKDIVSAYGLLAGKWCKQNCPLCDTLLHFRVFWVCVHMCSFSVHMLAASSCGSGAFSWCQC